MPSASKKISNHPTALAAGIAGAALAGIWLRRRATRPRPFFIRPQETESRGRALISGASSGVGLAFANQLAAQGYDLVVVARREDRLQEIAARLAAEYQVQVSVFPTDLTEDQQLTRLEQFISSQPPLVLLINSAGFGTRGLLAQIDAEKQVAMTRLHVLAPLRLTRAALPGMLKQGFGGIINVSSIAGFVPMPGNVSYSATKSYLTVFSEALQMELTGSGVFVQALCPGFFYSGFHETAEYQNYRREIYPKFMWKTADEVAAVSLRHLGDGQAIVIPGLHYQVIARLATSPFTRPIVKAFIQRLYRAKGPEAATSSEKETSGSPRQDQV